MGLAIGHIHKCRKISIGIKSRVEFYGAFGFSEGCPGENGQAEIYCCCVQQVDFAMELEPMSRRQLPAFIEQCVKHAFV
jgi:hypothetical protein